MIFTIIHLWPRVVDCCICEQETEDNYAVGYYCGPTKDPIGSVTTEYTDGGIVGGACTCKTCHDKFYGLEVA